MAVRECSSLWNMRDWLNTWQQWKDIATAEKLQVMKAENEDVKLEAPRLAEMSAAVRKLMGYTQNEIDFFQSSTRYINVVTCVVESRAVGVCRQRLWTWMVQSLKGTGSAFHYLVGEVQVGDVAALYRQLAHAIETPTIVSQADDLAAVFLTRKYKIYLLTSAKSGS